MKMRTKADVERAIQHLKDATVAARRHGDSEAEVKMAIITDVLRWVLGDDKSPFAVMVMGPCDRVDRAERQ